MSEDLLWEKFAASGSIADYLEYTAAKNLMENNNDNSRGNCS
ncbi:MAG: hypothetical protein ACI4JE_06525 [Ruminococcus sp.]|nr:hypothetical protein [Oscillospiraceae bacterium]